MAEQAKDSDVFHAVNGDDNASASDESTSAFPPARGINTHFLVRRYLQCC